MMLEEASKARTRRELQDGEKKRLREITENSVRMSSAGTTYTVGWAGATELYSNMPD